MSFIPWVFGDEYLYLSKARNLQRGIDVLADVSVGHTYPPLYSYLLSLVMGTDPLISYQQVQWLNLGVSQLLIFLAFIILNRVFGWTNSKKGWLFLALMYLVVASSTIVTGYYFVAMSENLYTPLVFLIFSLVLYFSQLGKVINKNHLVVAVVIGLVAGLALLTRTIGYVLIPAVAGSLLASFKITKTNRLKLLLIALMSAGLILMVQQGFTAWEETRVVRTGLVQAEYEALSTGYLDVLKSLVSGTFDWYIAFKIVGNHLSYLLFATFFFPVLFFTTEIVTFVKTRKIDAPTVFLTLFGLGSMVFSFLHCYFGFSFDPIQHSTYFRYFDQTVFLFGVYGLLKLWQWLQGKQAFNKTAILLFVVISVISLVFLPPRDFYVTLNSFGWAWLDLFIQQQWLIRVLGIGFVGLSLGLVWQKQLFLVLLPIMIIFQLASLPVITRMHDWLSSENRPLIEQVQAAAVDQGITSWYVAEDYYETGLVGPLYFIKYLLLFYTDAFQPVVIVPQSELNQQVLPYAILEFNEAGKASIRTVTAEDV